MTRPIVWAMGTLVGAVLWGYGMSDRFGGKAGAGTSQPQLATAQTAPADSRVVVSADLRGHFVVHPTLDGKRIRMLVDTGASVLALSHEDAQLAGIKVGSRDFTNRVATANGVVGAAPVRIREVRVGDILVRNVEAVVLPPGKLGTSLLGMSFLKRLGGFEIAQGRLVLKS